MGTFSIRRLPVVCEMDMDAAQVTAPEVPNIDILDLIGVGGMSTVFKGRHRILDEVVAVKVVSPSAIGELGLLRFLREAKQTSALSHPNIVKVFTSGKAASGDAFIVMEYLQGESLEQLLSKQGRLTRAQLRVIFADVLSALDYAHDNGLIHRDIKPANIILFGDAYATDGTRAISSAKLVDFGIAKSINKEASQKLTESGFLMGTPNYMSPEQCRDEKLDQRTDFYSLACVLYECLVGEKLFQGDTALDVMYKHLQEEVPLGSDFAAQFGSGLTRILRMTLSKDPNDRYVCAKAFREDLLLELEMMPTQDIKMKPQVVRTQTKAPYLWIAGALMTGIIVGGGMTSVYFQSKPVETPEKQVGLKKVEPPKLNEKMAEYAQLKRQAERHYRHAEELMEHKPELSLQRVDRMASRLYDDAMKETTAAIHLLWKEMYDTRMILGLSNEKLSDLTNEPSAKKNLISVAVKELYEARTMAGFLWPGLDSPEYVECVLALLRCEEKNNNYPALELRLSQEIGWAKNINQNSPALAPFLDFQKGYEHRAKERQAEANGGK